MSAVTDLGAREGIAAACSALRVPRASFYRARRPLHGPRRFATSGRALSSVERRAVLDALHEDRFVDRAPAEVYATLLDEGRYLCSERTMYRILAANAEARERRDQLRHPAYAKPELLATRPNQLWSWDITKLLGPAKWTYFHLYVLLDVFSRYVVGWMVAHRESALLAQKLIAQACRTQSIAPDTLTLHADRGTSMTSKTVALLLADLGVTKTHSRPHVSNDNPYSESQFKTLKYRPDFPQRFGCVQDARRYCSPFFDWYNHEHRHGGLGLLTPADVHFGQGSARREQRAGVLRLAYDAHPERFVRKVPTPPLLPTAVWINKPQPPEHPTRALERIADVAAESAPRAEGVKGKAAQSSERSAKPTLDDFEHGIPIVEVRDARASSDSSPTSAERGQ